MVTIICNLLNLGYLYIQQTLFLQKNSKNYNIIRTRKSKKIDIIPPHPLSYPRRNTRIFHTLPFKHLALATINIKEMLLL